MTDENKNNHFNLGGHIPPIHHWTDYTPVIPKLYWDVYSQEERLKKLCIEYDRLCAYANYLAEHINDALDEVKKYIDEIETIKTELENSKTRLTALENWQTTINTWQKTINDHLSDIDSEVANIKVDVTNIKKDITNLKNKFPVSLENISDNAKDNTVTAGSNKLVTSGAVYTAIKDITGFTKEKNCLVIGTFGPRTDLFPTNLISFTEIVDSGYSIEDIRTEALKQIGLGVDEYDYIVLTGGISNYFSSQEYPSVDDLALSLCINFSQITTALNNSTNPSKPKVFYVNDIQCDTEDVDVEKIGLYAGRFLSGAYQRINEYQYSSGNPKDAFINYSKFNLWPNKFDDESSYFDKNNNPTEFCTRSNAMAILGAIGYIQPPNEITSDTFIINFNTYMTLNYSQDGNLISANARGENGANVPLLSDTYYTLSYNNDNLVATQKENSNGWLFGNNNNANYNLMRILQRVTELANTLKILCDITAQDTQYSKNDVVATIKFNLNSYTTFNTGCTVVTLPGDYGDVSSIALTLTIKDIYL